MPEIEIELVQLENGDIALRHTDAPEQPLLTITFSDGVRDFLQMDQMAVARVMVEAGMNSYRDIQLQRIREAEEASAQGRLH